MFGTVTKPLIRAILGAPRHAVSYASDIPSLEYLDFPFLEIQDNQEANVNGGEGEGEGEGEPQRRRGFSLLMKYPTGAVHHIWRKFDDKFMRPVFGGRGFVPYEPASPTGAAETTHEH